MIVDSSALVAVVFQEPGYETIIDKLVESNATGIGTPTLRIDRPPLTWSSRALQRQQRPS